MAGTLGQLLNAVDEEVRRITDECYAEACQLLKENRGRLNAMELLTHETRAARALAPAARGSRPTLRVGTPSTRRTFEERPQC